MTFGRIILGRSAKVYYHYRYSRWKR